MGALLHALADLHMRPLTRNFEGLKRHSQLHMFVEEELGEEARRTRAWLVHVVHKASRHYTAAREMVLAQAMGSRAPDGGLLLPIWDFCLEIEDCIATASKAVQCAHLLANAKVGAKPGALARTSEGQSIVKLRNKLEHLYSELGNYQSGSGPIVITLDAEGEHLCLRDIKVPTLYLTSLLDELFQVVAAMFPRFDATSLPEHAGVTKLSMTMEVEVLPAQGAGSDKIDHPEG